MLWEVSIETALLKERAGLRDRASTLITRVPTQEHSSPALTHEPEELIIAPGKQLLRIWNCS